MTLPLGRYSSAIRRSRARRFVYDFLAGILEHDLRGDGAFWLHDLESEGIPARIVRAEAERILPLLRNKSAKREAPCR